MVLRKGNERLHYPCSRCKKMFERMQHERMCPSCYYEGRRLVGNGRKGMRKVKLKIGGK